MNTDIVKGKWHELKGKARERWGKLTDNDLTQINGEVEQLAGSLQKHYGYARDKAEKEIDDWTRDCGC